MPKQRAPYKISVENIKGLVHVNGGKNYLAHELQNSLCDTSDGVWLDYGEAKQGNWPENKPWPLKTSKF